jgi:hypothetical protein
MQVFKKEAKEAMRTLCLNGTMSIAAIRKVLGRSITMDMDNGWWYSHEYLAPFCYSYSFDTEWDGVKLRENESEIGLLPWCGISRIFIKEALGELTDVIPAQPDGTTLWHADDLQRMFTALDGLYAGGKIMPGANGRVGKSQANQVAKTHVREIDALKHLPALENHRARVLANIYTLARDVGRNELKLSASTQTLFDVLRSFLVMQRCAEVLVPTLMTHFTGLSAKRMESSHIRKIIFDLIVHIQDGSAHGEWHDMWRTYQLVRYAWMKEERSHTALVFDFKTLTKLLLQSQYSKADECNAVVASNMPEQFTRPLFSMLLIEMAYIGIVDVALKDDWDSERDSLADLVVAYRLTDVGKYVLGKTTTEPQVIDGGDVNIEFDIDDKNLIVRCMADDNPYESLLNMMAKNIGGHRYVFTEESFLSGCNNTADVMQHVELFKSYVSATPPQIWTDFFNRMVQRSTVVKVDKTKYVVLKLDENDRALLNAVVTDPKLRELCIRAEGHRVLIEAENYDAAKAALRAHGYVLK